MTSSKDPAGGPPGQQRGRRRPPTIELTATEIESAPATAPQAATPEAELPRAPEPAALRLAVGGIVAAADPGRHRTASSSAGADRPPRHLRPRPSQWSARGKSPGVDWLPLDFPWPLAAAGAVGVALTLIVLAMAGVFTSRESGAPPLEPRLARMEQQVRELAGRPPAPGVEQKSVDDLASRLARLETMAATPRPAVADPALANRIATLEGEIRALAEKVGVLGRRSDEIASIAGDARKNSEATAAALAELQKSRKRARRRCSARTSTR